MKKFIAPTYTFTPGASNVGTVNLSGIADFDVKYLVAIINQTAGKVIYATGSDTLGYASVVGTTITLKVNTATMSAGDTLQVIYESQTPENVNLPDRFIVGAPASASGDNALLASIGTAGLDVSEFRFATVQVISTASSGNYTFEQSQDGINWSALPVYIASVTSAVGLTSNINANVANLIYIMPLFCRFVRMRIVTALNAGATITTYTRLSRHVHSPASQQVGNNVGSNLVVNATVTSSALPTGAALDSTLSTLSGKIPSNLTVTANNLRVDGSQVTQPISAVSLPLPLGAASQTTLASVDTKLTKLDDGNQRTKITDGTNNVAVKGASTAPLASDPSLVVTLSPNSPPISVSTAGLATETTLSSIDGKLPALVSGKVPVDATVTATVTTQEPKPNSVIYLKLDNTGSTSYTIASGMFAKVYVALAGYNGTKGYVNFEGNRVAEIYTENGNKSYDRAYFEGIVYDGEEIVMEMTDKDAFQLMSITIMEYPA